MLVQGRKGVGGRKATTLYNPFLYDEEDFKGNRLQDDYINGELDINIEDIVVGIVRSYNADKESSSEYVDYTKVLKLFRTLDVFTLEDVERVLKCARSTANKYLQVVKACDPFIREHLEQPKTSIKGYVALPERIYQRDLEQSKANA